ncbi:MAG TPA: DMT family transporter [Chthoniobacterales bacterium]|jgi:drug/metabolite transporter (DMT)-like permease|nr:DMT family transporter [Chthoniobacterales bacterium]
MPVRLAPEIFPRHVTITSMQSRSDQLTKGYAALFSTVIIWSVPSLFQFYLNRFYDPWAQNFYRYLVACLAIIPFVLFQFRRGPRIDIRAVAFCLVPCLPNVVHQITQVVALFYMGPGVYAIFIRSSVIFSALLALAIFPEERSVIRQWQFQVGTLLGLVGAFGVIWFQTNGQDRHIALPGLLVAFTASFCWALYATLIKRPSARLGPIRSFGIVSVITTTLLLPLTLAFGNIATPIQVSADVNWILIVSAVTCITLAHVLYYVAIQQIGVALSQSLQLLCPLVALGLSALIFHERLTPPQLISAAVLLVGAFLAMRTKPIAATETAENI